MKILFWGTAIFLLSFALQLAWWRIRLPKRQAKTILLLYALVSALGTVFLAAAPSACLGFADCARLILFEAALIAAYVITYSAVEADSPSLVLILAIAQAGAGGLAPAELEAAADDTVLVLPRLKDMLDDKMAVIENGRYRLTAKGRALASLFTAHRKLMGTGKGS